MRKLMREHAALMEDLAYDKAVIATPVGRQSYELRKRAHRLCEIGRTQEAFSLLRQAVALHPEDDAGAATAAACHDLGHMLSDVRRDDRYRLAEAARLLRRALASPARRRVPRRYAETVNSLAVCLRRLARLSPGEAREELLDEAEGLYSEALQHLRDFRHLGSDLLARLHLNLGNLLGFERKEVDRALAQYERVAAMAPLLERVESGPDSRLAFHRARLHAAELLLHRAAPDDLEKAERLIEESLQRGEPDHENHAWLLLAEVMLARPSTDRQARAQRMLSRVRSEELSQEQQIRLAYLWEQAGAPDAALYLLHNVIERGVRERASTTIANHEADTVASRFQSAAALAARIHVRQKRALDAFLALENSSGLRLTEALSMYAWRPESLITQSLHADKRALMNQTYILDEFASGLDRFAPDAQREFLKFFLQHTPELPESERLESFLRSACKHALQESIPVEYLHALVRQGEAQVFRLNHALCSADAAYARVQQSLRQDLDAARLRDLLRQHPDHVLLRLSLDKDLLAIGVWLEEDQLIARSTTVGVPPDLRTLLFMATDQSSQFQESERLKHLLESMDLSAALPERRARRAILLPSFHAARLPLVAIGPRGARPLDRFESLIWLPCLAPLRLRPAATPPRQGEVVVAPGGTAFHTLALQQRMPEETRLEGSAAGSEAIAQAAATAHTLCFYTHGDHPPGAFPELELAGNTRLDMDRLFPSLVGIERVEIWACQSGAHHPSDPYTPPTDEGFGLDFELLHRGVRSAIGTLWPVPDLVTALLARRHRQRVIEGADPAVALADAQRWWQSEALPELLRYFREYPVDEAVRVFSNTLGVELAAPPRQALLSTLGEVPEQYTEEELEQLAARLSCPTSWAGIRFVGVPGQLPERPWLPLPERPLTPEEQRQLERLRTLEPPRPVAFDDLQEEWLDRATTLGEGRTPSPAHALEVARLLRDRLNSSHRDNLLIALAWLHEALAAPGLTEEDRNRLCVEAAHLWLELCWGEAPFPVFPEPVALARASRLLESLPEVADAGVAADAEVARAKCWLLQELAQKTVERSRVLESAAAQAAGALRYVPPQTPEALRVATVALELIRICGPEFYTAQSATLAAARAVAQAIQPTDATAAAWHRLQHSLEAYAPGPQAMQRALSFLTPRELTYAVIGQERALWPDARTPALVEHYNNALSRLEGGVWGHSTDDGTPLVLGTGGMGGAYRFLLKRYLSGHAHFHPGSAAHHLACLQYACDLRISALNRLACLDALAGSEDGAMEYLWRWLRLRLLLHTSLSDAALLPEVPELASNRAIPHRLDPYALSSHALREGCSDSTCRTAWSLADACDAVLNGEAGARTAAFDVVRASTLAEKSLRQFWESLLKVEQQAQAHFGTDERVGPSVLLQPGRLLQGNEGLLRSLPAGHAVLGLCLNGSGGLLIMACWNAGHERGQWTSRIQGLEIQEGLLELLSPSPEDATPERGCSASRHESWARVERALGPALETLFQQAQRGGPLRWGVLAPGALRPLPLLGLRVGGSLLADQVVALSHLPALGFMPLERLSQGSQEYTACLLARESKGGTTRFGAAVVETLRSLYPPALIVDPKQLRGTTIVEVDALEPQAARLRTLRLYGVGGIGSLNDTTAVLHLEGGRALRERNTHGMPMPGCEVVELWACTAGSSDRCRVLLDHEDRIPGLAASFLACGAAAVIDLAWPVHDVVKALVCEHYELERRRRGHGPEVLARAVVRTASMLERLRQEAAGRSVREVLDSLDAMRQHAAVLHYNVDLRRFMPFAGGAHMPPVAGLTGDALLEEICQPVHLGAFRWWGA